MSTIAECPTTGAEEVIRIEGADLFSKALDEVNADVEKIERVNVALRDAIQTALDHLADCEDSPAKIAAAVVLARALTDTHDGTGEDVNPACLSPDARQIGLCLPLVPVAMRSPGMPGKP